MYRRQTARTVPALAGAPYAQLPFGRQTPSYRIRPIAQGSTPRSSTGRCPGTPPASVCSRRPKTGCPCTLCAASSRGHHFDQKTVFSKEQIEKFNPSKILENGKKLCKEKSKTLKK